VRRARRQPKPDSGAEAKKSKVLLREIQTGTPGLLRDPMIKNQIFKSALSSAKKEKSKAR
jgi:hypothetical protein